MKLKKNIMSAMGAFFSAGGFSIKQYQKELSIDRDRILEDSQVVKTAQGLIEYSTTGKGLPVLFIHGAGGGHDMGRLLIGHSYGGWLGLNMALAYPDRLRKIVLLAPAASFYPLGFITKLIFYLAEFKIRPPARSILKVAASKGTVLEEIFVHHMEMVSRYCLPATMFPTVYTDEELKQINLPALLLIGAGEKIYNPKKAIERAQRWMPELTAEIIPDAGHILIMDQPEIINARILRFLGSGTE